MMAPYRGDGKSVVDAVFTKAEAQGRARVLCIAVNNNTV